MGKMMTCGGFLDTLSHDWVATFLQRRVAGPCILRLVQTWRRAGVAAESQWSKTAGGVPPEAVLSLLLAKVSLPDGVGLWVGVWRLRAAQGAVVVVRVADAGRAWEPGETASARLCLHALAKGKPCGVGQPETSPYVGCTHCGERPRNSAAG